MRDPILNPVRVIVDAGHGGKDPGATYGKLKEKEIVLEIALIFSEMLTAGGFYSVMTRRDDTPIYNSQRTRIANNLGADVFVSVHCNADADEDHPDQPEAKGSEIWIYPGSRIHQQLTSPKRLTLFPKRYPFLSACHR